MIAAHENATVVRTQLKVGLEIHVELATRTKMFSRVANPAHPDHDDAEPNSLVDPVVAALPGSLPVMNKAAIEMSIMVGLALRCRIASHSKWDRKNYYYPDLPKGYQISQYDLPLCGDGAIDVPVGPEGESTRRIGIIRAHLEEDTGKLGHELPGGIPYEGSLVDLNRAGTPLLEIVTQPDFDDAEDVVTFARELRNICRFLGVTEGVMQKGHMRFEPNVNVILETSDGHHYVTPIVEVKNLNSFRALRGAILHEAERQVEEWRTTGRTMGPGMKSTRGWDDERMVTVLQREKEDAHDYRYFPDPDLVPVVVSEEWLAEIKSRLPELPIERRKRYMEEFNLPPKDVHQLVDDRDLCFFFEEAAKRAAVLGGFNGAPSAGYATAKMLLNNVLKRAHEVKREIAGLGLDAQQLAELLTLREQGTIGPQAVDPILSALLTETGGTGESPSDAAKRLGLVQVRDEATLDAWCDEAIKAQHQAAADVRSGKDAALGRLVGAVMKLSGGRAEARSASRRLLEKLGRA